MDTYLFILVKFHLKIALSESKNLNEKISSLQ